MENCATNSCDAIKLVVAEAARISERVRGAVWYLFGSHQTDRSTANDIDLLVVYLDDSDADIIRAQLEGLLTSIPIHLMLASGEEESELNFIAGERCRQIYPPSEGVGRSSRH